MRPSVETIVLDSCNSTWEFQPARMRFRRTLKDLRRSGVTSGWHDYHGLEFQETFSGFVVLLNARGSQLLRSWCHQPGYEACELCTQGVPRQTEEVSLEKIHQLATQG